MVIKIKIFVKCNAKEFDCLDFYKKWISNFNVYSVFLVGDYHIWSFTNVERKYVGLKPVINSYQSPVHRGMNFVNVNKADDSKTIGLSAKWTKCIWFEDLYMSLIYKRKSTESNT